MQILVVEDEHKIAGMIKRGLVEERYAVDISTDGEDALYKFSVNSYDLILLDIMLPKIDGVEVCRKIRSENENVPIIMLTAKGEIADRVRGLDSGADDYLVKPFAFNELTARVRSLLRRGHVQRNTILSLDDLALDPSVRGVTRGGEPIDLTAKEYALTEYMLRNAGIALSKTQIIEHVWDYSYVGMSNIVETYIKYLRKKLQKNPKSKALIHTIRGYGYVMKLKD